MRRPRTLQVSIFALACLSASLLGCPKKSAVHEEPVKASVGAHTDEAEHKDLPKSVRLTPQVIADIKLTTEEVRLQTLSPSLSLPGEITVDPDRSARVSSPVAGRIVEVRFKEGSVVKKGDALALVRIPELGKVRAAYTIAAAKGATAKANAQRLAELSEKGLAPAYEAQTAKTEAQALAAESAALGEQLAALGANGSGSDLILRAPVSGMVVSRDVVVGQPINADYTLASIADLSEVWFLGRLFEKDIGRVRIGAKSAVTLNAYPNERFEGTVEYLGRQIDVNSRTLTARIRVANRGDLLNIGLFGSVRIDLEDAAKTKTPVLMVPRTALIEVAGKSVVFVRHPDDDFELHEVVVGEETASSVGIVSGLREHELVVTHGLFTLKSMILKSTLEEP
jgi:membrane fusion protein, heavy metal efflux system